MLSPSPLYVDTTILKAVARCDTAAVLRHVLSLTSPEERIELSAGLAVHEALAEYLRTKSTARGLAVFDDAKMPETVSDHRLHPSHVRRLLWRWFDTHEIEMLPWRVEPTLIEVAFQVPLVDDIVFCGRMDAIGPSKHDGWWYVIDHKTTGQMSEPWLSGWHIDAQITGYVYAAQQHLGPHVVGAYINAIELPRIPASTRKCSTHGVPYAECGLEHAQSSIFATTRSAEQIADWRRTAIALAERYRTLRAAYPDLGTATTALQQGRFNNSCRFCEFDPFCRTGRQVSAAALTLIESPWSPGGVTR